MSRLKSRPTPFVPDLGDSEDHSVRLLVTGLPSSFPSLPSSLPLALQLGVNFGQVMDGIFIGSRMFRHYVRVMLIANLASWVTFWVRRAAFPVALSAPCPLVILNVRTFRDLSEPGRDLQSTPSSSFLLTSSTSVQSCKCSSLSLLRSIFPSSLYTDLWQADNSEILVESQLSRFNPAQENHLQDCSHPTPLSSTHWSMKSARKRVRETPVPNDSSTSLLRIVCCTPALRNNHVANAATSFQMLATSRHGLITLVALLQLQPSIARQSDIVERILLAILSEGVRK